MLLNNGYEVPPGYESISCYHDCGYFIMWPVGHSEGVGEEVDSHYANCPNRFYRKYRIKGERDADE